MEWPPPSVKSMTFNTTDGFYEVELVDGRVLRQATVSATPLPQEFRRVTYNCTERTMKLVPASGDAFVVDVFDRASQPTRSAGRPVIYLDQNQWIQLARAVHSPHLLNDDNQRAAERLIGLAAAGEVILPLSSGHMIETAQVNGNWRRRLAPIMVRLSRGWVMRDPLVIRVDELRSMFTRRMGGEDSPIADVFTLDLSQLFAEPDDEPVIKHPDPDASPVEQLPVMLSAVTAIHAMLLEDDRLHSAEGAQRAAKWAAAHQSLAAELASKRLSERDFRQATLAMYLSDLQGEIAECAHDAEMPARGLPHLDA